MIPFDHTVTPEAMASEVIAAFRAGTEEVAVLARVDHLPYFSTVDTAVNFIKEMVSFASDAAIRSFSWGASGSEQYVSVDFVRAPRPSKTE